MRPTPDGRAPEYITETPEWRALALHQSSAVTQHLRDLFAGDPNRGRTMWVDAGDLYLDYSKNHLTSESLRLLVAMAEAAGLPARIEAMFNGERINASEDRAVLHVALASVTRVERRSRGPILISFNETAHLLER